jgi:hypothetical protein
MATVRAPIDAVSNFPRRIYESLRAYLDKDDVIAHRDWKLLVSSLGLSPTDKQLVEESDKKTEVALGLWQQRVGPDVANGRTLVEILKEMGRIDAAKEVERFLGTKSLTVSGQIKREFDEIDEAAKMGDIGSLETLIGDKTGRELDEKFKDMYRSPLHSAVYYGHLPTVKYLVEKGFDIRRLDQDGNTPRYWADREDIIKYLEKIVSSMEGTSASRPVARSELDQATFAGNYKRMEELLKQGFDVNQSSPQGQLNLWTPLHTAARRGDLRAVRLLVENGANIEMEWEELTAEDYARKNEYIEISDFLKRKRKELEKDVERVSQMQLAKLLGQTVTIVLQDDEDAFPHEFQIQSLALADIMKGISEMLGVETRSLKTKQHGTVIIQTRDLLFARDLIACTIEELPRAVPEDVEAVDVVAASGNEGQRFGVYVQHFRAYWSRPAEEFKFSLNYDYNAILREISDRLGLPVDCLYTSDKLSKIKQTRVLSTKSRVIAAAEHDRVKEESGSLGDRS